jgi:transposase
MARPYSEDLRARVVAEVEAGASRRKAAARYQVSISFVVKLMQRWRCTGSLVPGRSGGRRPHRLEEHGELVRRLIAERPDRTLEELAARLAIEGVQVGRSSIDRFLKAIGLTRKKRRNMRPSRTGPTSRQPGTRGVAIRRP